MVDVLSAKLMARLKKSSADTNQLNSGLLLSDWYCIRQKTLHKVLLRIKIS
jgi:hypothetical protein